MNNSAQKILADPLVDTKNPKFLFLKELSATVKGMLEVMTSQAKEATKD